MARTVSMKKFRASKELKAVNKPQQHEGFQPCSPDMTICGDCADNRAKKKCPRLAEWLSKRQER